MRNRKGPKSTPYLPLAICTLPKDSPQFRASDNSACRPQLRAHICTICKQKECQEPFPKESVRCIELYWGETRCPGESRAVLEPTLWMRKRQSATTWAHHLAPAPQVQLHDVIRHRSNITATLYAPLGGTICGGTTVALRWKPVQIQKSKVTLWVFRKKIQPAQKYRYMQFKHWNGMSSNNTHKRMDTDLESPALFSSQPTMPEY